MHHEQILFLAVLSFLTATALPHGRMTHHSKGLICMRGVLLMKLLINNGTLFFQLFPSERRFEMEGWGSVPASVKAYAVHNVCYDSVKWKIKLSKKEICISLSRFHNVSFYLHSTIKYTLNTMQMQRNERLKPERTPLALHHLAQRHFRGQLHWQREGHICSYNTINDKSKYVHLIYSVKIWVYYQSLYFIIYEYKFLSLYFSKHFFFSMNIALTILFPHCSSENYGANISPIYNKYKIIRINNNIKYIDGHPS